MAHLVTGSAGFIGSYIVDAIINNGDICYGVDDLSGSEKGNVNAKSPFFKMDCADLQMDAVCRRVGFDHLWYLAADATEGRSQFSPYSATHNNMEAYMNTLSAFLRYGDKSKKKVILFSSMAVYGSGTPPFGEESTPPFNENAATWPIDIYGWNKLCMEESTRILAKVHGFGLTIIRPHNVFGIRQKLNDRYRNVVAIFMNKIMRKEPLIIYGNGEQKRAYTYIDNALPSFMKCQERNFDGQVFNIGGKREISVNELAQIVILAMDAPANYPIEHVRDRPQEVKNAYSSWEKSERMLDYVDRVGIESGVYKMCYWAKRIGPQEWNWDDLEIDDESAPDHWRNNG